MKIFEQELQEAIDRLNNAQECLEHNPNADQSLHIRISEITDAIHRILIAKINSDSGKSGK